MQLNALDELWEDGGEIVYRLVEDSIATRQRIPVRPLDTQPRTAYFLSVEKEIHILWRKAQQLEVGSFGLLRKEITANLQRFSLEGNEHVYLSTINGFCERQHQDNIAVIFGRPIRIIIRAFYIPKRGRLLGFSGAGKEKMNNYYAVQEQDHKKLRSILDQLLALHSLFAWSAKVMAMECQNSLLVIKNPERYPYLSLKATNNQTDSTQQPQPAEPGVKKSKKKTPQLTTKRQMIMLDMLGFLNAPILANLTTEQKGAVLANLLNRSEQEVRGMLTYWHGNSPKPDYNCKDPDDQDKVIDFLLSNSVEV